MHKYTKSDRRKVLAEALARQRPETQVSLLRELKKRGIDVTQATVSRDLQEMGYVRVRVRPGVFRYERLETGGREQIRDRLKVLFGNFVTGIKATGNLLLVKTSPGNANGVASLIDGLQEPAILGTVAGDDTILVVVDSVNNRRRLENEFQSLL